MRGKYFDQKYLLKAQKYLLLLTTDSSPPKPEYSLLVGIPKDLRQKGKNNRGDKVNLCLE